MARTFGVGICLAALLAAGCAPLKASLTNSFAADWPVNTKPVVKIGLVAPFEGLYRPLGYEVLHAVKAAVSQCNEEGGAAGYMVELVALDDSNDPEQAAIQAKKMAIDPDVMGVIGGLSSGTALAAFEEYHRNGLAFVALAAADGLTERCYPEVFRLFAPNRLLGTEAARFAVRELGATKLAILGKEGDLMEAFVEEAKGLRARVTICDSFFAIPDSPELIFLGGGAVEGAELARQIRGAGFNAQLMGGSELCDPKLIQIGGEAAEGTLCVTSAPTWGVFTDPRATLAYDAARILLEALAKAVERDGGPSREGILSALAETHYVGLSGEISFDACGNWINPPVHIRAVAQQRSRPLH